MANNVAPDQVFRRSTAVTCVMMFLSFTALAAQADDDGTAGARQLIKQMVGTWHVEQSMWSGPGAPPTPLPDAIAQRQAIGDYFVEETMATAAGAKDAFKRISHFGYNNTNRQFEYFSIDSRLPQMMNERSESDSATHAKDINMLGGLFIAPQWGKLDNAAFRYRITVSPVHNDRQQAELYLTPLWDAKVPEFLAFRYVYIRKQ